MKTNASYIHQFLAPLGWSVNAIAGMLGNMETESTINPSIWQNLDEGNTSLGYGLVQWTPATKYLSWCSENELDPASMSSALSRIEYERANGLQWISTEDYPLSFDEFKVSTASPSYLAQAFLRNYERPADQDQPARSTQAEKWYTYLTSGDVPSNPSYPIITKKKSMSLWLMLATTRRR